MLSSSRKSLLALILAVEFVPSAYATDPLPKYRAPDDRMLQQSEPSAKPIRVPMVLDEVASQDDWQGKGNSEESSLPRPRGEEKPKGIKYGRYCENGFARAGYSFCIGRFAKPSTDANHQVGYVGGGTLFGGSGRRSDEGTFGMDYSGSWFSRKTWLKWSHGGRYQGGAGRYETEAPRILPE